MLQRRYVMNFSWQRVGGYLINLKVGKSTECNYIVELILCRKLLRPRLQPRLWQDSKWDSSLIWAAKGTVNSSSYCWKVCNVLLGLGEPPKAFDQVTLWGQIIYISHFKLFTLLCPLTSTLSAERSERTLAGIQCDSYCVSYILLQSCKQS